MWALVGSRGGEFALRAHIWCIDLLAMRQMSTAMVNPERLVGPVVGNAHLLGGSLGQGEPRPCYRQRLSLEHDVNQWRLNV